MQTTKTPGFYRGPAWYRKQLFVDKSQEGRQAVIYFEGANQEVRFYLNGQFVGEHKGGYTRFCFVHHFPFALWTGKPVCHLCEQCL